MEYLTLHFRRSRWWMWVVGISTTLGVVMRLITLAITQNTNTALMSWLFAVVPNLPFCIVFVRPYAGVTVFGKRGKASMHWFSRQGRALRTFHQLATLVRKRQERDQAHVAGHAAPVVPVSALPPASDALPPIIK